MPQKALLAVSFGTSYPETRKKTIDEIENSLRKAFPDRDFYQAFTSRMIIKKLKNRDGEIIRTPEEMLEILAKDGYTDILVQTTHIIPGYEYRITAGELRERRQDFEQLKLGNPLLTDTKDYLKTAEFLGELYPKQEKTAVVLMGHGSAHTMNAAYSAINWHLQNAGRGDIQIGCVEGYPEIDEILVNLKGTDTENVILAPFMIVAGDHARNDMTGGEDSWQSRLQNAGYQVQAVIRGMGEYSQIRDMFVDHAYNAPDISEIV